MVRVCGPFKNVQICLQRDVCTGIGTQLLSVYCVPSIILSTQHLLNVSMAPDSVLDTFDVLMHLIFTETLLYSNFIDEKTEA